MPDRRDAETGEIGDSGSDNPYTHPECVTECVLGVTSWSGDSIITKVSR